MPSFDDLIAASSHSERVRGRRLAKQSGVSALQALQQTLEDVAGAQGLAHLLTSRARQHAAELALRHTKIQHQADLLAQKQAKNQAPTSAWRGWFDGSAHPNPGRTGIGALLLSPKGQKIELSERAGHGDSSEAEYCALIALLEAALPLRPAMLFVYGDSQVIIDDVLRTKAGVQRLTPQRVRAQALMAQFKQITLQWIPRHKNGAADQLSQQAISLIHPSDAEALKEGIVSA